MSALLVLAFVFRDIAATVDGGAWLVSQDNETWHLERVLADGGRVPVVIGGIDRIETIATRGETLWILTPDAVVVRSGWKAAATTIRVEIPSSMQRTDVAVREPEVTPLGNGRALVMRACAGATTRIDDCTEVITVDTTSDSAVVQTWPVQLSRAVADERGGAWMRVAHDPGADLHARGSVGYAHASTDGVWDLWSFDGMVVSGMTPHDRSDAFPEYVIPAATGVIGVSQYNVWPIDEAGVPRVKLERREIGFLGVSQLHGVAGSGGELVLLTGVHEACCVDDEDNDDVSPALRWVTFAGVERTADRAPAPSWWRDAHREGTPRATLAVAAGVAWILFEDLVMMRVPPAGDGEAEWRIVAQRERSAEVASLAGSRHFWSFTTNLGYSRAGDDDGFAWGLRLERMRTARRKRAQLGTGGFAEVGSLGGRKNAGTGLSLGLMQTGVVASFGASVTQDIADAWHPQFVFSLFLGKRFMLDDGNLEAPVGVRFEIRPGTEDLPTTFMVATSLDALVVSVVAVLAGAM